ncbi:MAG TPA: heparan-alpha-glucosaminide N-acetyltransferase domain-containing protein [Sporichthyaceae bacterium]|nr:heparan-alpha-glucosaminide N-acetyltransferase domain-containing protein [Sporichthyaceae bacterium]
MSGTGKRRVIGVDVTRGIALLGMMAVHAFPTFHHDGTPTLVIRVAGGRSAATFAVLAGVTLAFLSGGRHAVRGTERIAVSAGVVVRAVLIAAIGLSVGYANDADVILGAYALLFVLALPLLGLSRRALVGLATLVLAVAPVVLVWAFGLGLGFNPDRDNPTLGMLLQPAKLAERLLISGSYPVIAYLAYILVGLAIGRSDLNSIRVAWRILGSGLALAVVSWVVATYVLFHADGLAHLADAAGDASPGKARNVILWEPIPPDRPNWWWPALRAQHSNSTLDLLHTLGCAMALLGLALLVCRVEVIAKLLYPLAAAGSMSLTVYTAHLIVLATGVFTDQFVALFVLMGAGSMILAVGIRRFTRMGPLEFLVSSAADATRRLVRSRLAVPSMVSLGEA